MEILNSIFAPIKLLVETVITYFSKKQKIRELSFHIQVLKENDIVTKPLVEFLENKIYEYHFGVEKDKFMFFYNNPKTKGDYDLIRTIGMYTSVENEKYKVKMDLFMKSMNWAYTLLAFILTLSLTYAYIKLLIVKQIDINYIVSHKKEFLSFLMVFILNLFCLIIYTKPLMLIYNYQKRINKKS